jgi:SsrA-binding protein
MKILSDNRRARFDYHMDEKIEAGIELQGWEVKSARAGEVSLGESFVWIADGSAWLKNAYFAPYKNCAGGIEQELKRDRRLLLRKSQIEKLHMQVKAKGFTCVVNKLYLTARGLVKVEIALAKGKHTYDKKKSLKEKDILREAERDVKRMAK